MTFRFDIDNKAGIIREYFEGEVSAEFIIKSIFRLRNDKRFHPDFDSLVDLRRCSLKLELEDFPKIYKAFGDVFRDSKGRSALLVDNPRNTALAMLFQKKAPMRKIATFSTEEMALEWLSAKPIPD